MRVLLLDVGNTRLKWGLFDGTGIGDTGSLDRLELEEHGASLLIERLPGNFDRALAASVGGHELGNWLVSFLKRHFEVRLCFARVERAGYGVINSYSQPAQMGVDRWAAMVGAWAEQPSASLVVDTGTAVTIDALDDNGRHLGGQIIPGLSLMARSLAGGTSGIPMARPDSGPDSGPKSGLFGSTTAEAVRLGSLAAIGGAVERALRSLRDQELAPVLFLTGGDASRILDVLDEPALHRPHLVLSGLACMLDDH